jgi:hypothetical protein
MNKNNIRIQDRVAQFFQKHKPSSSIAIVAITVVGIFVLCLIVAHNVIGGSDFYIKWSSLKLLRSEQINPYSSQAIQRIAETAEESLFFPLPEGASFTVPVYSLFLYYPFTYLTNFETARSLWMTCLCILLALAFERKFFFKTKREVFLTIFILVSVFSLISILGGDLLALSFALLLFAYQKIKEGKFELAGMLCGLATMSPGLALAVMIFFLVMSLRQRQAGFLIWFLITTALLGFSGNLLQEQWGLQFVQANIRMIRSSFADLGLGLENIVTDIKIVAPFAVIVFEWIRTHKDLDHPDKRDWLFHIILALLAVGFGERTPSLNILFLPALLQIFHEWVNRDNKTAKIIGYINLGIYMAFSILILVLDAEILVGKNELPKMLFWFTGFHVIVSMYWIRGWLYQDTMRNYIKPE